MKLRPAIALDSFRWFVSQRPLMMVIGWIVVLGAVVSTAPSLTDLAARGQSELLPTGSESAQAAGLLAEGWPGQWSESAVAIGFYSEEGVLQSTGELLPEVFEYAARLINHLRTESDERPTAIGSIIGPDAAPELRNRLKSGDGKLFLTIVSINDSFVGIQSREAVDWLQEQAASVAGRPENLRLVWSGNSVIGRDYMGNVQETLDRAAYLTVVLLLVVLLAVYRSLLLALIPLITIGVGLLVSRGVLAYAATLGWQISSLVELFLVVILFGCGTDYCLLLSWRFSENWNAVNQRSAIRVTMGRVSLALITSAATTIVGLSLMGLNRFKLFSSTGPSVSIGLVIVLFAALTLTPALLYFLARSRPKSFRGMTRPRSGLWDRVGRIVLNHPWLCWSATLLLMTPSALLGLRLTAENRFIQDTVQEMPTTTPSVEDLQLVSNAFGPGETAPLTIVLETQEGDPDFRSSEGLEIIDAVSRLLSHQRSLAEVRSATQPLGTTEELDPARISNRLGAISDGFNQLVDGASELRDGLNMGGARIQGARLLGNLTGFSILGETPDSPTPETVEESDEGVEQATPRRRRTLIGTLAGATRAMGGQFGGGTDDPEDSSPDPEGPIDQILSELAKAARGAEQIREGASRAQTEIEVILEDPVGRRALDRLLINQDTVRDNPELLRSFETYINDAGNLTRIDVVQRHRPFSTQALDEAGVLRRRLDDYLSEYGVEDVVHPTAVIGGANAESLDIRTLTRRDQYRTWIIVPLGVFLVLTALLRSPIACFNLVSTMVLTYAFALGITHVVFVEWGGAPGLDWKVPYFLFVLLVAVGVDYNVFLMSRLQEESKALGLKAGIIKAIGQTGGLITSAAVITACSFAALMWSPLSSLRQLGFALVVGILTDAALVRPVLVPCGQWLISRGLQVRRQRKQVEKLVEPSHRPLQTVS